MLLVVPVLDWSSTILIINTQYKLHSHAVEGIDGQGFSKGCARLGKTGKIWARLGEARHDRRFSRNPGASVHAALSLSEKVGSVMAAPANIA